MGSAAGWLEPAACRSSSFGRMWDEPDITRWVDVDGQHGTAPAVEHCAEPGYRRIAFLGWPRGSAVGDDRREAWLRVPRWEYADLLSDKPQRDDEHEAAALAVEVTRRRPSARRTPSLCASDVVALGVHLAARACGPPAGADMGIVGFDDSRVAEASA